MWVIEDATFNLDLDEYFEVAERIYTTHFVPKGSKPEFLKRDNLPRDEDFGIVSDDDNEDLIVNQLENFLISDNQEESLKKPAEEEISLKIPNDESENKESPAQPQESADDIDALLDDLIESKD